MRKKNILMAALTIAATSLISCAPQTSYVIEGELTGLEEGTEIQLFQNDEVVLTSIASTRWRTGSSALKWRWRLTPPYSFNW